MGAEVLNLSKLMMIREPFPYGEARDIFEPDVYDVLTRTFPLAALAGYGDESRNTYKLGPGHKYSLSEHLDPDNYWRFINSCKPWGEFRDYLNSMAFRHELIDALARGGVMLALGGWYVTYEFSYLPGDKGYVPHHVDVPVKILAIVIPMMREGEWDPEWDGTTEYMQRTLGMTRWETPKGEHLTGFRLYPPRPNTCDLHINTLGLSWHQVRCRGPHYAIRKTLTVNLMKYKV